MGDWAGVEMYWDNFVQLRHNKGLSNQDHLKQSELIKSGELGQAYCILSVISELANTWFMLEKLNILAKIIRLSLALETKKL